ncbi:MAG: hypothetical protein WBG76_09830, partial [Ornithinimicrobium sp.]
MLQDAKQVGFVGVSDLSLTRDAGSRYGRLAAYSGNAWREGAVKVLGSLGKGRVVATDLPRCCEVAAQVGPDSGHGRP